MRKAAAELRPVKPAEAPNGARRLCGEPSGRMAAPAPEGGDAQHRGASA